jgi:hypothetical protein
MKFLRLPTCTISFLALLLPLCVTSHIFISSSYFFLFFYVLSFIQLFSFSSTTISCFLSCSSYLSSSCFSFFLSFSSYSTVSLLPFLLSSLFFPRFSYFLLSFNSILPLISSFHAFPLLPSSPLPAIILQCFLYPYIVNCEVK